MSFRSRPPCTNSMAYLCGDCEKEYVRRRGMCSCGHNMMSDPLPAEDLPPPRTTWVCGDCGEEYLWARPICIQCGHNMRSDPEPVEDPVPQR